MPEIDEKVENCRIAMKAALEAVNEYCGGTGNRIEVGGMSIEVPRPLKMYVIRNESLIPRDELINTITTEPWTQERATEVCEELLQVESGTHECNRCVEDVARSLAERIVGPIRT